MSYQAAAIQYDCRFMDKEYNLEQLAWLVRQAVGQGAKLVVLPEMCATGYYFDSQEQVAQVAEPVPDGKTTQLFMALARELDCYIVAGLPEQEGARFYNTAILVGPDGFLGRHRKTHHYIPDSTWAKVGDHPPAVFDTTIGSIAIQICMDVSYPEAPRISRLQGAQILCVPMNWSEPSVPSSVWITRARENGMYVVAANRFGQENGFSFSGGSAVIDPEGSVLDCLTEGDGIVMGTVDLSISPDRSEFPHRRPELYSGLLLQRYPWYQSNYYQVFAHKPLPPGGRQKVAVQRMCSGSLEVDLEYTKYAITQAAQAKVSLLVLPELALGGVPKDVCQARTIGQRRESPLLRELSDRAVGQGVSVIFGFVLEEDGALYNAAACLTADGQIYLYKKSHLNQEERLWARPGDQAGICVDLPHARVGILLGDEAMLPEVPRLLANYGCDILAIPAAQERLCAPCLGAQNRENPFFWHIARVRANENNVYAVFSSQVDGSGIFGPDMFLDPRYETICAGEEMAALEVDTDFILRDGQTRYSVNVAREKPMLSTRHTIWYDPLLEKTEVDV